MKLTLVILFLSAILSAGAQIPRQTVKGTIKDEASGVPLITATIVLLNTDPLLGAISDENGKFVISGVPVGRYNLSVTYVGYQPVMINEILVSSTRETVVDVAMQEQVTSLGEVLIKPKISKEKPINTMASVSARMLSVEEASRYAGGADDPARLASSFAGVSGNMVSNGIIVRGNAPKSFQWRMEGIEIPNPNHFADVYAFGGGGLTALSSQLIANSDFLTGAFPAEYSNALSGVFDIYMRTGNSSDYQHTFQAGAIGLDFSSEGPFRKGYSSSYLFNYRYSTLALLTPLLPEDAEGTTYQDISLKLNFPTKKAGTFSIWGLGLSDGSGAEAEADSLLWTYNQDKEYNNSEQFMGAGGINHIISVGKSSSVRTSLAATILGLNYETKRMNDSIQLLPQSLVKNRNINMVLTSAITTKFSNRHTNKTGFTITALSYDMLMYDAGDSGLPPITIVDENGSSALLSAYTASSWHISDKLSINCGLTGQLFTLNKRKIIEPRAGITWQFNQRQSMGLAYGLHSRLERINYYFVCDESSNLINKDLDFTKAHHIVLSYSFNLNDYILLKAEPYLQLLYNVPVEPGTAFSFLNLTDQWFYDNKLTNEGEGKNYGIDLTVEKYLYNGNYFMATGSLFESKYKTNDDVWRDTRFNLNFVFNLLGGKEWYVGKDNRNVFSVNARITYQGGERYTPVNQSASAIAESVIYDESRAYKNQLDPALITHLTVKYRLNNHRTSHEFALKILNLTNYKDFYGFRYNHKTKMAEENREAVMIPNVSYRIEF